MAHQFALLTHLPGAERNLNKPGMAPYFYRRLAAQFSPIRKLAVVTVADFLTGWLLGCPWRFDDNFYFPVAFIKNRLMQAASKARDMGAEAIGWRAGSCFPGWLPWLTQRYSVWVLTGQALDIYASVEWIRRRINLDRFAPGKMNVLVNPIQSPETIVLARLLARDFKRLTLAGGNMCLLSRVADQIRHETGVVCSIKQDPEPYVYNLVCVRDWKGLFFSIRTGAQDIAWRKVWFSLPWKLFSDGGKMALDPEMVDSCTGETILFSWLARPELCYTIQPLTVRVVETFGKLAREYDIVPREVCEELAG
ncbi:MAG: hypothetical protein ACM3WV_08245 [Bacillota bacterium]